MELATAATPPSGEIRRSLIRPFPKRLNSVILLNDVKSNASLDGIDSRIGVGAGVGDLAIC